VSPAELARLAVAVRIVEAKRARTSNVVGDPVAFARLLGMEPDPWQERLLHAKRDVLLNCSRQAGKSTAASMLVVHRAVTRPKHLALLISPSDRQSGELFRKVRAFLDLVPGLALAEDNARSCRLANGSRIVSLPSSAETIRGFSAVDTLVEDEAAFVDDTLNMTVRPMLAVSKGQMILMSTPNGRKGHFFDAWERGGAEQWHREEVKCWDVPRIPRPFLEEQRKVMGEFFRQEFECQFMHAATGRVYEWDEQRDVIDKLPDEGEWTWVLGMDFGTRDKNANTVIGWRHGDASTYIARSYRYKGDPHDAAKEVRLLEQDYEFVQVVGDLGGLGATFGDQMASRHGIPVVAAKKADKQGHIRLMNGAMRQGRLKVVRGGCPDLLEEWRDLPWREDGTREAEGYTADASDSALYAFMATFAFLEHEPPRKPTEAERVAAEERSIIDHLVSEATQQASGEWWQ
jgi:hypothetical protein